MNEEKNCYLCSFKKLPDISKITDNIFIGDFKR